MLIPSLIDYFSIIVDYPISKNDKAHIYNLYPWASVKFTAGEAALDIVYSDLVTMKPRYWANVTTDFVFHKRRNYLKNTSMFMNANQNVKQVSFNRCFAENFEGYSFKNYTETNGKFLIHKHDKTTKEPGYNKWPSFTLKPSITLVKTIIGFGKITNELDYSTRFLRKGYNVAFFKDINYKRIFNLSY